MTDIAIIGRVQGPRIVSLAWERAGLGVHETIRLNPNARVLWSVTHIASGLALVRAARSLDAAIALAELLLPLADWQQDGLSLRRQGGLEGAVKAVLRGDP